MFSVSLAVVLSTAPHRPAGSKDPAGLPWSVQGPGGGHSSADAYSLDGTLGQPLTEASAGGTANLTSGFWQADTYLVYVPQVSR